MTKTASDSEIDYLRMIKEADVYDVAIRSPLEFADLASKRLGNKVWLKREDLQPVFSFKLRGAYNRIARLNAEEAANGVICCSAGNHAQGVALAAGKRGISALIVMPITTPSIKVDAVRQLGGEVRLFGESYDDAQSEALRLAALENRILIHPFDDPYVIAGQGTIGVEILDQCDVVPDAVFIPIGGGGLMAGIATWIKTKSPSTRIIGVEPRDAASMHASLRAGSPVTLESVGTFADGVAVKRVGDETFRLCQPLIDEIILVDTDETCAAIQELFEETRVVVEPAGALALAALKRYVQTTGARDQNLVALACGANMNFDRLRHVVERAAVGKEKEALLGISIPEEPGSFGRFCQALGPISVTEFNYRLTRGKRAQIFVGIALANGYQEKTEILARLHDHHYAVTDLSDNELAKLHVRHMVGGSPDGIDNERLYRFRFPERPGALLRFLEAIGDHWNISLFHYRNHGSDYGRILAGIQVMPADSKRLAQHLQSLGYLHWDETDNPAFQLFLQSNSD